jgi:hypothetical protein
VIPWFVVPCNVTSIYEIADFAHDSKETDGLERRNLPSNWCNWRQLRSGQVELLGAHMRSHQRIPSKRGMEHRGGRDAGQVDKDKDSRGFFRGAWKRQWRLTTEARLIMCNVVGIGARLRKHDGVRGRAPHVQNVRIRTHVVPRRPRHLDITMSGRRSPLGDMTWTTGCQANS